MDWTSQNREKKNLSANRANVWRWHNTCNLTFYFTALRSILGNVRIYQETVHYCLSKLFLAKLVRTLKA